MLNGSGSHHHASDFGAASSNVADRLYGLDRNINGKFDELARTLEILGKRTADLEDTVEALPVGGEPSTVEAFVTKIDGLGDNFWGRR